MNAAASTIEPQIADGVLELLRRHDCERELWDQIELSEAHFPDRLAVAVAVTPDPDEAGHFWVGLEVTVPAALSWAQIQPRRLKYIADAVARFPARDNPTFVLAVRPAPE